MPLSANVQRQGGKYTVTLTATRYGHPNRDRSPYPSLPY